MPDFTKGSDHLTIGNLTSYLRRNPKGADMGEMVALMQQIDTKFKETPGKTVLSALLLAHLQPILDKILQTSDEFGDTFGPQILADIKIGRTDRLMSLGQLCSLNCFRLKWAKNDGEPFDTLRKHIVKVYKADVRNPNDRFMYVPARSTPATDVWMLIDGLAGKGGVIIYDDIRIDLKDNKGADVVTVIQLCDIL